MALFQLERDKAGLLVVDVQEKLFPLVDRQCEVGKTIQKAIRGFQALNLPIILSEQYPKGLGHTIPSIRSMVGEDAKRIEKTTFSCIGHDSCREELLSLPVQQWVIVGIEAHVCVLQTAKDLLRAGKQVVILNDAISSRSVFDFSTAIAEMRDCGARISCTEAVLFELVRDSKASEFKALSELIK